METDLAYYQRRSAEEAAAAAAALHPRVRAVHLELERSYSERARALAVNGSSARSSRLHLVSAG